MIQNCVFDPARDIEQTVPDLAADVAEVMATHTVPSVGADTPYSKETDIKEVGHYLRDKIQTTIAAMNLGKSISAAREAAATTAQTSTEA